MGPKCFKTYFSIYGKQINKYSYSAGPKLQTFMAKLHDQEENSSKVIKVFEQIFKSNST